MARDGTGMEVGFYLLSAFLGWYSDVSFDQIGVSLKTLTKNKLCMNQHEFPQEKETLVVYLYRIEDINGDGPFKKGDVIPQDFPNEGVGYKRNDGDRQRFAEWLKLKSADPKTLLSGAKDPLLLREYFPESTLKRLMKKGYRISKYRIPQGSVFSGQHESLFRKEDAQLVVSLDSFEELEKRWLIQ